MKMRLLMYTILSILILSLSSNIDTFTIAITYGIRKIKIKFLSNLLISLITGLGTFLSMSIGLIISRYIPMNISSIIGNIMLITIGIWFLTDALINHLELKKLSIMNTYLNLNELLKNPERADSDQSGFIDWKESIFLAFALTINNFALGIGASITGLNIFATTICTFLFSIWSILFGSLIGKRWFSDFLGTYATIISSIIIILLGLYKIITVSICP
jgi:putative sporulation protein YtaF